MNEIKKMILRANNIPDLKVQFRDLEESVVTKMEFNDSNLKPYIRTGARIKENIIELPSWDDEELFNNVIPPWGFHKFCAYETKKIGVDLVQVRFRYGKKVRKSSDFRFKDEKEITYIDFYFLFDYDLGHYIEVNPEKSEEWKKRISIITSLEQQTFLSVCDYLIKVRPEFTVIHTNLQKNNSKTHIDISSYFNTAKSFLNETELYIGLIYVLYGDITRDEFETLEEAIRKLHHLISKALGYIERFNNSKKFDPHHDYLNRPNKKSEFGVIAEAIYVLDNFLKERREKVEEDGWFAYNSSQGYLKVDKEKNVLYPTLSEIERRRSIYKQAANDDSEKVLLDEIIRRLKK